jgi:hypothetical protein
MSWTTQESNLLENTLFVGIMATACIAGGLGRLLRRSNQWVDAYTCGLYLAIGVFLGAFAELRRLSTWGKGAEISSQKAEFLAALLILGAALTVFRGILRAPPSHQRPTYWATGLLVAAPIAVQWVAASFFWSGEVH